MPIVHLIDSTKKKYIMKLNIMAPWVHSQVVNHKWWNPVGDERLTLILLNISIDRIVTNTKSESLKYESYKSIDSCRKVWMKAIVLSIGTDFDLWKELPL